MSLIKNIVDVEFSLVSIEVIATSLTPFSQVSEVVHFPPVIGLISTLVFSSKLESKILAVLVPAPFVIIDP